MKKMYVTFVIIISSAFVLVSCKKETIKSGYLSGYSDKLNRIKKRSQPCWLLSGKPMSKMNREEMKLKNKLIQQEQFKKNFDFWLR